MQLSAFSPTPHPVQFCGRKDKNPYGKKPLIQRLKERSHQPGDLPTAFGLGLEMTEFLAPGDQHLAKFGITWLIIGGLMKAFNNLGKYAIKKGDQAVEKMEITEFRDELDALPTTEDPEDVVDAFRKELDQLPTYHPPKDKR